MQNYIVTFESNQFDLKGEKENPINPIRGLSIGEWIVPLLNERGVKTSSIEPEDWGWYLYAEHEGSRYLLGFAANEGEEVGDEPEIMIQIEKQRTFLETILFKNKMEDNDGLLKIVENLASQIPNVKKLETQPA